MKRLIRVSIFTASGAFALIAAPGHEYAGEAIRAAREALASTEAKLGPDHPATAMMLRELALAFEEGGYHQSAEYYANQSLRILEAHFGPDDVSLVPALNVLTEAAAAQGRNSEALRLANRAIAIGPGAGPHYGTALHSAAAVLYNEGRLAESEKLFLRALAAREATLPPGHPYIEETRAELKKVQRAARLTAKHMPPHR
jgi:tetratricopeptide (TPR) repeat protein